MKNAGLASIASIIALGHVADGDPNIPGKWFRYLSAQTIHNPPTQLGEAERNRRKTMHKRSRAKRARRGRW